MNFKQMVLAASVSVALAAGVDAGTTTTTTVTIEEPEVRTIVTQAGYADPVLVERDGTLWRVVSVDPKLESEVTLFVDADGRIMGAADVTRTRISETTTTTTTTVTTETDDPNAVTDIDDLDNVSVVEKVDELESLRPVDNESKVTTIVMNAGFHNVHDIDYLNHRGVWKAEADDITGEDFEVHVDPNTGLIVHVEDD